MPEESNGFSVYIEARTSDGRGAPAGAWTELPASRERLEALLKEKVGIEPEEGACALESAAYLVAGSDGGGALRALGFVPREEESLADLNDLAWIASAESEDALEVVGAAARENGTCRYALQLSNFLLQDEEIPFAGRGEDGSPTFDPDADFPSAYACDGETVSEYVAQRFPLSAEKEDDRSWREACAAFKADPWKMVDWHFEKDRAASARAKADPPCWGGFYRTGGGDACVPEDDFREILPTEAQRSLYLALCSCSAFDPDGTDLARIAESCEDARALAELAAERGGLGYDEAWPDEVPWKELVALAGTRPDLFDEASLAEWPELEEAAATAALEASFAAAEPGSKAVNAERLAGGRDEKAAGRGDGPR